MANPEIADVSPLSDRSVYIFGRRRGVTTLTLLGENGRLITNVTVEVRADHTELKERLQQLLPKEPIEVRTAAGGLVLSGTVSGKAKVDRAMALARAYAGEAVTNMMTVGGTQQVMLRVRIAEMSRSVGKDLGISTSLRGRYSRAAPEIITGNALTVSDPQSTTVTQGASRRRRQQAQPGHRRVQVRPHRGRLGWPHAAVARGRGVHRCVRGYLHDCQQPNS